MTAHFDLVTFDAADTETMAQFWSSALRLHEVEREDGDRWIVLADEAGTRRLGIQRGSARPGSVHLDLACDPSDFEAELDRLLACGARLVALPRREAYGSIANLVDPDGNAFDLCAYDRLAEHQPAESAEATRFHTVAKHGVHDRELGSGSADN